MQLIAYDRPARLPPIRIEPQALTAVLAVVQRANSTFVIRHSGLTVASGARTGAVTLIQRFGSALNLNIHLHMLFLDGAYGLRGNRAGGSIATNIRSGMAQPTSCSSRWTSLHDWRPWCPGRG